MQKDVSTTESMRTGRNSACTKLAKLLQAVPEITPGNVRRRIPEAPSPACTVHQRSRSATPFFRHLPANGRLNDNAFPREVSHLGA